MSVIRYYWSVSGMKDVTPGLDGVGPFWVRAEDYEYLKGVSEMQERFLNIAMDRANKAERELEQYGATNQSKVRNQPPQ